MPLQATSGAASYDAFGGGVPVEPNYIESCFSTYLYTGNSSTQTITNGIDLAGSGGLVWSKDRTNTSLFQLASPTTGVGNYLISSLTNALITGVTNNITSFNSNGYSIGANANINASGNATVSWTFRKQPKFFDVVTYTGTGSNTTIAHALGSVPGCIMVKRTDTTGNWQVYHSSLANTEYLVLNSTAVKATGTTRWNSTTPTSAVFSLGTDATVNASGGTYVAYIFAHDAGGFGLTGTDNVISCGSFTTDASGAATVNLGYEPQWLLFKNTELAQDWWLLDNMRGWPNGTGDRVLIPNLSDAEANYGTLADPTATGFNVMGVASSRKYIYIAIRRGPMKVPTDATKVFDTEVYTGNGTSGRAITAGFPVDLAIGMQRTPANGSDRFFVDRLRSATVGLVSWDTFAEATDANSLTSFASMTGVVVGTDTTDRGFNGSGRSLSPYFFRRAPSFFDEVCYTGDGATNRAVPHNLGAAPQLVIVKCRSAAYDWIVGSTLLSANSNNLVLNTTAGEGGYDLLSNTAPTSTNFYLGTLYPDYYNASGRTYVAYLFSTCAGVSKVGKYTGTGTTKQIDCGFTAGARFVMIKRIDFSASGDWYVWDSARGIVAGNDPYLLLNSTAAEVTGTDYVDTAASGFELSSTAPAAINASGGTYLFLAIA